MEVRNWNARHPEHADRVLLDDINFNVREGEIVDQVRAIGRRLAAASADDDPGFDWEFNVIQSDQANAFCLPGGKMAVGRRDPSPSVSMGPCAIWVGVPAPNWTLAATGEGELKTTGGSSRRVFH